MRLGIAAYFVPFIFALHPPLILIGTLKEILIAIITASIGVVLLGAGCAGYLFRPLSWTNRGLLWLAALLLLLPSTSNLLLFADFAGFALVQPSLRGSGASVSTVRKPSLNPARLLAKKRNSGNQVFHQMPDTILVLT